MNAPLKSKLDALFAKAEKIVLAKQGSDSRVVEELHNLSGQFFAGTLLHALFTALRDALYVLAALAVFIGGAAALSYGDVLAVGSLLGEVGVITTPLLLIGVGVIGAVLSFYCCKRVTCRRFQHSALMSALVLIIVATVLVFLHAALAHTTAIMIILFFALYYGYRRTVL